MKRHNDHLLDTALRLNVDKSRHEKAWEFGQLFGVRINPLPPVETHWLPYIACLADDSLTKEQRTAIAEDALRMDLTTPGVQDESSFET